MGCSSTVICQLGSRFFFSREGSRCSKDYCASFSIHTTRSWVVFPFVKCSPTIGLRQSTSLSPLLASQEKLASSDDSNEDNVWQRCQLLQRLLDVSVAEENYLQAKQIYEQLSELRGQLPESEQILLNKIDSLGKGSIDDRVKAIADLGEIGDDRVLPILVGGLLDNSWLIASETEKAMWKIFMRSGSKDVDRQLQEGLALMISNDLLKSKDVFTKVIEMAPSFAEGWNKRATVNYLLQDYEASIMDCKQTLDLNPCHFGALSGMGLCYAALKDSKSALFWFEKAYSLHPGLVQINKFIKMLKQKLHGTDDNQSNKEKPGPDT